MRETDLVLGPFADARLDAMSAEDLDAFEALLEAPDQALWNWVLGRETPDPAFEGPVLDAVLAFGRDLTNT